MGKGDYMDAKKAKLEDQFRQSSSIVGEKLSNLFAGISIFVNGYTNPSADELKLIMMQHGGVFHHYKRSNTTYTIASILPDVKVRSITSEVIISPRWVVDCLAEGKILEYSRYLLYTQHKPSQPKLAFAKRQMSLGGSAGGTDRSEADIAKPVPKKDNDPNDISRAECLNVLGMLRQFTNLEQNVSNTERQEEQPVNDQSIKNAAKTTDKEHAMTCDPTSTTKEIQPQVFNISPEVFEPNEVVKSPVVVPSKPSPQKPSTSKQSLTATDPNFLTEFFNNSRLHHIATLGASFKQYVAELRDKSTGSFPAREILIENLPRRSEGLEGEESDMFSGTANQHYIMHIDMDCFFVSVGLRNHPHLRGLPVAVTHSRGSDARVPSHPGQNRALEIELYQKRLGERYKTPDIPIESRLSSIDENNSLSEIASCSYEARRCGVKNGMFVGAALKLCPELKTIPYDFDGYREVAHKLYNTIAQYTLDIEAVSCDEMFVDLTELLKSTGVPVMNFVSFVRDEISTATGCACSAGIGTNRLQARMATKRAKPNGQFRLRASEAEEYMREIPIADLPGVGPSTSHRLKQMTYVTCADLQTIPRNVLQTEFGKKFGETLYNACRGIDERPLVYDKGRKSVSVDVNYGIRFTTEQEVDRFMRQLTEEIHRRLVELRQRGKLVTVKLLVRSPEAPVETAKFMGHGLCDIVTKSQPLQQFTDDRVVIEGAVLSLMRTINAPPCELRGIGIQISKFEGTKGATNTAAGNRLKSMLQNVEHKNKLKEQTEIATSSGGRGIVTGTKVLEVDDQQPCTSRGRLEKQLNAPVTIRDTVNTPLKANRNTTTPDHTPPRRRNSSHSPIKSRNAPKPSTRGRRGRPPKWATTASKKEQKQTVQNGMLKFLTASATTGSIAELGNLPPGLDPEVLAALPEDIRQEAIRDYRRQQLLLANNSAQDPSIMRTPEKDARSPVPGTSYKREWKTPTTPLVNDDGMDDQKIKVELKFLQALPPELRLEVEKQIELNKDNMVVTCSDPEIDEPLFVTPEPSPVREFEEATAGYQTPTKAPSAPQKDSNILRRSNWRELLEEWLDSTDEPYEYDVLLLADNGKQLVEGGSLERLYLFVRCFYRLVQGKANNCSWHRAYSGIVRTIQNRMLALYGKEMAVQQDCGCVKCNIKTM
ncbi:DNA repair protein Rev1 isoform X2 [Anopheles coustani]|uniref:DNA repair protein Rev1 isoform X2 n=1 Tax=Anopheles coustani TaxID=139045 RepID=UPI00265AB4B9|nr:DNA repair protein Rev1 isoform X2 [Anopheles coustani]